MHIYTTSESRALFNFAISSANVDQFYHFLKLLNSEITAEEAVPNNLLLHYLVKSKCLAIQLYNEVSSNQNDEETFNYSKYTQRMPIPRSSLQINLQSMFRMSASSLCVFESCAPLVNGRLDFVLLNAVLSIYLHY